MNDPQVVALIYTVEPVKAGRYDNANPLRHSDEPEFDLTVEDKIARFEFKKLYRNAHEARAAIEPFIQNWELKAEMRAESDSFRLRYKDAEIVDRNPLPPRQRPAPLQARTRAVFEVDFSVEAEATLVSPDYPPPPVGGSANLNDPDARSMYDRYVNYRSGNEPLLSMVYFCLTVFEYRFIGQKLGKRKNACRHYHIDEKVLDAVGNLTANKGDLSVARKRAPCIVPLTRQEEKFLTKAVQEMVCRAAQVAADDSQNLPQITMASLPRL